jgi:CHASE2 domain-containing sensor protein
LKRDTFDGCVVVSLKAKWTKSWFAGAIGAIITVVLGLCVLFYGVGNGLRHLSFDLPFAFRPTVKPADAVIVYMDETSHGALDQQYFAGWDRRVHAALLERLKAYSVKAVAFDVLFDDATTNDTALMEAAKAHGKVVFGARFTPFGVGDMTLSEPKLPCDELRRVASWGVAETADEDGVVRQHYRADRHSTNLLSLAWRTAELAGAHLPSDAFIPRYLNYYGRPGTIPWLSYVEVLSNRVSVSALSNKVVFVGARVITGFSGGNATDIHPIPHSRWTGAKAAGVEINATAFLNLARGDWLTRISPMNEFFLVVGAGVVFGVGLMLVRPIGASALAASAMLLVFIGACVLMWQRHLWFSWAILSGVQIPCAALCAILFRTQGMFRKERKAFEETGAAPAVPSEAPPLIRQRLRQRLNPPSPETARREGLGVDAASHPPAIPDCTLLRRIGAGAYGEVWLGINVIGAFRAVKVVYRRNFNHDRPYEREFEGIRNFDPLSRNHPGLVQLLHVGRNDDAGYFFYVMELADDAGQAAEGQESRPGQRQNAVATTASSSSSPPAPFEPANYTPRTLQTELYRHGRFQVEECLQLGLALTDALDYLHRHQLIHRDIKPSKIIFVAGKPKLADIGLVTQIGEGRTFVGTEGFSPPEGPGSPAGDIYSLGKVLYEALTGLSRDHFPNLPKDMEAVEDFSRWKRLNKIVLRACEHNLRKRYTAAREMRDDLLELAAPRSHRWDFFRRSASAPRQP